LSSYFLDNLGPYFKNNYLGLYIPEFSLFLTVIVSKFQVFDSLGVDYYTG
jgi:hypothetical protein